MHDSTPGAARTANLLGAATLAVADLVQARVRSVAGVSSSGAAAMVVLAQAPGLSVTELGRRVGLSQPAAARMTDALESAGLVTRTRRDGRTVAVTLTSAGELTVERVRAARSERLATLLAAIDPEARRVLDDALERLLARLHAEVGNAELLCRLCDRAHCTDGATCPVGQAEREGGT